VNIEEMDGHRVKNGEQREIPLSKKGPCNPSIYGSGAF
jgi:hypothetical protein